MTQSQLAQLTNHVSRITLQDKFSEGAHRGQVGRHEIERSDGAVAPE
jgi:hypothetical protein